MEYFLTLTLSNNGFRRYEICDLWFREEIFKVKKNSNISKKKKKTCEILRNIIFFILKES